MDTNWSFLDFPYICRICCSRKKLELFECHGSLLELFNNITNISVEPTDLLPKNVCNNCIRKLQEMSKFIEDSKYIDLQLKQEVAKQDNFICKQENIFIMDNSSEIVIKREEEQIEFFNAPEDSGLVGEPEDLNYLDYKINIKELEQYNQCNVQIKSEIVIDEPLSKPENRVDSLRDKMRPYNCEICFKDLASLILKKSHVDLHFQKYVVCFGCGKSFIGKHEYMNHYRSHIVKQPILRCKICTKLLSTRASLKKHFISHKDLQIHNEKRKGRHNKSSLSSSNNSFQKRLLCRMGRYFKAAKFFPCKVCSKPFTTAQRLQFHQRTHIDTKLPFLCEVCLKCFSSFLSLRQHRLKHVENHFQCAVCSFSFSSKEILKKHIKTHTEKPHECNICLKRFPSKKSLLRHGRVHEKKKIFGCPICLKTFTQASNLRAHLISHTSERHHQCTVCSRYFTTKQSLRRHAEIHEGEKSFHCTQCSKSFFYQFNLNRHQKIHITEKQCRFCSRTFPMKHMLLAHERTHTGEKPFSCNVCGWKFSDSRNLYEHKTTHTGEKKHQCMFCLKKYARKRYLMVHYKICKGVSNTVS